MERKTLIFSSIWPDSNDSEKAFRLALLALAACLYIPTCVFYGVGGFRPDLFAGWCLSLMLVLAAFSRGVPLDGTLGRHAFSEGNALARLWILLGPLYLLGVYTIPHRVNTDEMIFLITSDGLVHQASPDLFGITHYFGFPGGSFILIGRMCQWFGGVGLEQARWVNGFFGLCTAAAGYMFYRFFGSRREAWWAALLLGVSHALVGLSRMAIRDNLPVFLEILALTFLLRGLVRRSSLSLLLGGMTAGLGVYNYYSGRIIFIVWTAFLIFLCAAHPRPERCKKMLRIWSLSALAFFLTVGPMMIATWKGRSEMISYPAGQFVFSSEGHHMVEMWEGQPFRKAYWSNLFKGLGTFNNGVFDRGNIYINPGHGFLDPLSGILLWIGVAAWFFKRKRGLPERLAACGLSLIWLSLSFLTTKNPEYSRMLVVLPFAIIFAFKGAVWLVERTVINGRRRRALALLVLLLAAWNVTIYLDQTRQSRRGGDIPGDTARYVQQRAMFKGYSFYMVMDDVHPYFWFGKSAWKGWVEFFAGQGQSVSLVSSLPFSQPGPLENLHKPFTLFMNETTWHEAQSRLLLAYPKGQITPMAPSNHAVALEVLS